jgi:hypothetical protein
MPKGKKETAAVATGKGGKGGKATAPAAATPKTGSKS